MQREQGQRLPLPNKGSISPLPMVSPETVHALRSREELLHFGQALLDCVFRAPAEGILLSPGRFLDNSMSYCLFMLDILTLGCTCQYDGL